MSNVIDFNEWKEKKAFYIVTFKDERGLWSDTDVLTFEEKNMFVGIVKNYNPSVKEVTL